MGRKPKMNTEYSSSVFSERLKSARIKAELSQKALSEQSGVSPLSICGYESSVKTPVLSSAYALAVALNVSLDWLCGLSEENPSASTTRDFLFFLARVIDTIADESILELAENNLVSGTPIYDFVIEYIKFKGMLINWNTDIGDIFEKVNHLFQDFESYSVESLLSKK